MATSYDTSVLDATHGVMLYQSYAGPHQPKTAAADESEAPANEKEGIKGKASFQATLKESAERVREELPVYDVRPGHGKFEIDTHGFITAKMTTALPQTLEVISDPDEVEIRKTYWPEVEDLAFRTIRRRDGSAPKYVFAVGTQKFVPLSPDEAAALDDPFGALSATYARIAHSDFSEVVFVRDLLYSHHPAHCSLSASLGSNVLPLYRHMLPAPTASAKTALMTRFHWFSLFWAVLRCVLGKLTLL